MALGFTMKSKSHPHTTPAPPIPLLKAPPMPTSLYLSRETQDIYNLKYILFKKEPCTLFCILLSCQTT